MRQTCPLVTPDPEAAFSSRMYAQLQLHPDEGEMVVFTFQESKPERRGIKKSSTGSAIQQGLHRVFCQGGWAQSKIPGSLEPGWAWHSVSWDLRQHAYTEMEQQGIASLEAGLFKGQSLPSHAAMGTVSLASYDAQWRS